MSLVGSGSRYHSLHLPVDMEARIRIGRKLSYTKFFSLEGVGVTALVLFT